MAWICYGLVSWKNQPLFRRQKKCDPWWSWIIRTSESHVSTGNLEINCPGLQSHSYLFYMNKHRDIYVINAKSRCIQSVTTLYILAPHVHRHDVTDHPDPSEYRSDDERPHSSIYTFGPRTNPLLAAQFIRACRPRLALLGSINVNRNQLHFHIYEDGEQPELMR